MRTRQFDMFNDAVYLFLMLRTGAALTLCHRAAAVLVYFADPEAEAKTRFMSDAAAEEIAAAQPDLVLLKSFR